jgi:hypothetical protein
MIINKFFFTQIIFHHKLHNILNNTSIYFNLFFLNKH